MLFKDLDQKLVHLRQQQPRVFNQAGGCERIREYLLRQQRCQLLVACDQFVELHDDRMPDKKRSFNRVNRFELCFLTLGLFPAGIAEVHNDYLRSVDGFEF